MRLLLVLAFVVFGGSVAAFPVERCINLSNALDAPEEGLWGYRIERPHLQEIADAGFDTIRLPVRFSGHLEDGKVSPALLKRVDQVIDWASGYNLSVILVLHHFFPLMEEPDTHAPTFRAIWQQLADHYAGHGPELIFELLNEPEDKLTTAKVAVLYSQLIPLIREQHPTRWIITGGGEYYALEELENLPDAGAYEARTFHYYAPYEFTHQQAQFAGNLPPNEWGDAFDRRRTLEDFAKIKTQSTPVFLGEFGVYSATDQDQRAAWTRHIRQTAEANGMAWCYWGFSGGFDAFDVQSDIWHGHIRDALLD